MNNRNPNNYCIIMAGGVGARFWPMSKTSRPKQFLDILGTGKTLLQQAYERFLPNCPPENIYIITHEQYKHYCLEQLPEMSEEQVVCEPLRRNTAPCIAYTTYKIMEKNPDANFVVAPSDHIILKENEFCDIVASGLKIASEHEWLLTLGIKPNRPDTGYGYIQFMDTNLYPSEKRFKKVKTFTEKPQLEMAKMFLLSGEFLWNAGIFIWSGKTFLKAFEKHLPEINSLFKAGIGIYNTDGEKEFVARAYEQCRSISIDYGVMEKADNVFVLEADIGWSDLGTWSALYEHSNLNKDGNAVVGKNVMLYDCKNCIINMPKDKLVVLQGLNDYIVVDSDNILLVCRKADEQQIRQFVNDVKIEKGEKFV